MEHRRPDDVPGRSDPRVIHAFAFDPDHGTISNGRILATVPEDIGAPDGMTVFDAAGDLWVAIYGGSARVNRYALDGSLRDGTYPIPARDAPAARSADPA